MSDKYRILIAEDFKPSLKILCEIVSALGYEYETATNGYEVINKITQSSSGFDAVLTDLQMPLFNGFETVMYIRRNLSYPQNIIPVIAMTGRDYAEEMSQTYKDEGFDSLIVKPFSIEKLDAVLKRVLKPDKSEKISE